MDFEEQMDLFFIRKTVLPEFLSNTSEIRKNCLIYSKHVFRCIPLMLKHLKAVNENWRNNTRINKIFADKVQFKLCLVYGTVLCKERECSSNSYYALDDGTGSLTIKISRRTNDVDALWKLGNELETVEREMLAQNKKEIVDSLRNLLFKAKTQSDSSNLTMGSKVLVYGKPTRFRGEILLNVYCFLEDGKTNRDIEISFKDYLIEWYRNNSIC